MLETELGVPANRTMTDMAPGDVMITYADISHARSMLGYDPSTTIEQGLRKFVRWYKSDHFKLEYAEEGQWNRKATPKNQPTLTRNQ